MRGRLRGCEESKRKAVARETERHEKGMRVSADLVPGDGSLASQSSESHVTLREEITAEGSQDFHGS